MDYYALDFNCNERFSGSMSWMKSRKEKLLYDRWDWPFWRDEIASETALLTEFDDYVNANYPVSFVSFFYQTPPPLMCYRMDYVSRIGEEEFFSAFWPIPIVVGEEETKIENWICVKEKPDARVLEKDEPTFIRNEPQRGIYCSMDYPLILRKDIYERVRSFKVPEGRWIKYNP